MHQAWCWGLSEAI